MINELGLVTVGSVDSGKSTLIGTLISDKLDDGNGRNRLLVSAHNHEKDSGKTSSIAVHSIKNFKKNNSIVMIDLCGHEKYLKTTLYGIMGYYPDYAIIIISANRGILKMTREHTKILHHLKIPMIIVVTKIDLIDNVYKDATTKSSEILDKLINDISKIYSKGNYNIKDMNKEDNLNNIVPNNTIIPLFKLSCKTGEGLELFKNYISKLPKNKILNSTLITNNLIINNKLNKQKNLKMQYVFYIEKTYTPPGIGTVVTGILKCSNENEYLEPNTILYLGPSMSEKNDFIQCKVWSIYNYYDEKVDKLYSGQRGCLALRSDKKFNKDFIKKGSLLTNNIEILKIATYKYKAEIKLLSHPSNVRDKFSPIIYCATIRQSASIKILEIILSSNNDKDLINSNKSLKKNDDNKKCIFPGDKAIVALEFKFKPEIIEPNESFFLREGLTLGVGKIIEPII